jgi:hypothetical protein
LGIRIIIQEVQGGQVGEATTRSEPKVVCLKIVNYLYYRRENSEYGSRREGKYEGGREYAEDIRTVGGLVVPIVKGKRLKDTALPFTF